MEKKIPNIDSLMNDVMDDDIETVEAEEIPSSDPTQEESPTILNADGADGNTLWNELMTMLKASKENKSFTNQKIYKIDADIIETLSQCNFNNHSICHVINCILRTFLIANIRQLDGLRRHAPSLFDNYLQK